MSTPYIVKGAEYGKLVLSQCASIVRKLTVTADIYPRLEVSDLIKDEYQFSLFIQAMSHLQAAGYKPEPASWQEIGGIHGLPYARWR